MQKKVDLSTYRGHLVRVAIERPDEHAPWTLAVSVRPTSAADWTGNWIDGQRAYFTCFDALAAGKRQAARMIDGACESPIAS